MDTVERLLMVSTLIILLVGSGFFSASETAFMSLNKIKLRNMEESGVKKVKLLLKLLEDESKLLTTILIGNNIVNIAASSLATSLFMDIYDGASAGIAIATFVMTLLVLIFGEITPKSISNNDPEKVALAIVKPLSLMVFLLTPFVRIFDGIRSLIFKVLRIEDKSTQPTITEEELKTLVTVSHEEGVIECEEHEIINNVFKFGDKQAKEAMINRLDIVAVSKDCSYRELMDTFKEEKFTRMPVYDETIDSMVGLINIKDIIFIDDSEKENFNIERYIREPFYTYEYKKISELLEDMKKEKVQLAIVVDEYGATSGLITIENLLEEIVGDIEDEYDQEEEVITKVSENEYIVDGSVSIDEVNEVLELDLKSEDFDSIGGYLIEKVNGFPELNQNIELEDLVFIIEDIDKVKINKIRILKQNKNTEANEENMELV